MQLQIKVVLHLIYLKFIRKILNFAWFYKMITNFKQYFFFWGGGGTCKYFTHKDSGYYVDWRVVIHLFLALIV